MSADGFLTARAGPDLDPEQSALLSLLQRLEAGGYAFTTVTSSSHGRVVGREPDLRAETLRDLLGWSLPADAGFDPETRSLLETAGAVRQEDGAWRSTLRVSRLAGRLFLHSAWPTRARDAVFLGPDSYRFARFLRQEMAGRPPPRRIVDIGAGAGVGGIVAAGLAPGADLTLTDINPAALRLAAVNALHAGLSPTFVEGSCLDGVAAGVDLVVANPPFMNGSSGRTYSAGGDLHGGQMSVDWARAALDKLAPGGRLLMYTGSAILAGGEDRMAGALAELAAEAGARLRYEEIDPDIFGDVLGQRAYADVERIAAVGVVIDRAG